MLLKAALSSWWPGFHVLSFHVGSLGFSHPGLLSVPQTTHAPSWPHGFASAISFAWSITTPMQLVNLYSSFCFPLQHHFLREALLDPEITVCPLITLSLHSKLLQGSYQNFDDLISFRDFPGGASDKEPVINVGETRDAISIPWLGRTSGEGTANPLQYSWLGNPLARGAWRTTVHGTTKSQTQMGTHAPACTSFF